MEMLERLNQCIDYIEKNLDGVIDPDELSAISMYSHHHFQKMFSVISGCPLAEYIRKRRLTVAAQELMVTEAKVIDVALKYGYETPESFSKAFRKLHGVPPSRIRSASVRAYPRLGFKLQITGVNEMNYRMVEKEAFEVAGIGRRMSTQDGENLREIPKFWEQVNRDGIDREICRAANADSIMGVCLHEDRTKDEFTYFIGAENTVATVAYETHTMPAATWAVFEVVGPMPLAIQRVWERIFTEWFPSTGFEHSGGPEFELYPMEDAGAEDFRCEVWVPVKNR
ncbi:AraC family transcriptional regulator [Rossellomorea marisflavi]|uniref:AraC family transcriptional regulator n=1 Tax=Rossellomorea marisflavi TaxID=189381 RepID=A0A161TDE6_9BACI|nr:AraC family transcriptional regulator [Rossellomorea marisflavi]KZE48710.1 AraC family transcriptional regulator [Rossellomorea marisflavi]MCM2605316.1 AraC family transcriptional regulator [Rossellomorea marisflavi]